MSSPSAVADPSTLVTSLAVPQSSSSQKSNTTSNTSSRNGSFGKDSNTQRGGGDGGIPGPSTHQIVGTYTAEETAFHRAFPAVPLSEKLVDQYQCSVMRNKVVRLGKLYLTNTRLCFTSTFLRDPVNLPWEAVASVQRRTNFLFDSVVVKRTKEAMDAQHHARHHNHHHGHSRSLSQGAAEVLGAESEAGASTGGTSSQRQSEGPVVDHALNEQLYGSGGVGDEEALTGFISGSSDQAFRMIQMLWSVRSRYHQQKKDEEDSVRRSMSTENLSNATTGGTPTVVVPAIESPHLGSGGAGGGGSSSSSAVDGSSPLVLHHDETGEDVVATTVLTPMDRELQPPSTYKLATSDNNKDPLDDDTVVTPTTPGGGGDAFNEKSSAAAQKKKKSRTMSAYVSSSFRSSMSAVSSVMPSSTGLRLTPRASTTAAPPSVIPTSASPDDSINPPPYVLHPSDDEAGGTPEEGSASDEDGDSDDDENSPHKIPQPMSPLQQAAGVAAGDVNAHRYTALLLKSFPLVPKNEVVIESFQCSYVSGVHRLGRLYVTSNYLLFSSPFMSEGLVIRLVDAASVSRWQTMKVLDGLSIDIRPDARAVTTTQLYQAGGAIPAAAINSSRVSPVLNPSSSVATIAEANDDNAAAPSSPNTPRSRTSSLMRQETQEPAKSEDGVASLRGSSTPQNLSLTSSSSPTTLSDSGVVYTKASYAFTSFVGSRDAALKLIRHLHAPHYIRAEEAVDATKEATQNLTINTISATTTNGITSPTAGASPSSPTTSSPTTAATMSPTTTTTKAAAPAPPVAVRPPNDAAFYITAPKVEDTYTALKTVYGTDLSPIGNFFGGDNSKKLLAEQPVYFPEGVGLMDVFRDAWSDDTRAIDQYHSDRKDTEMSWTKWAPIVSCEGHTAVTTQLAETPASSLGSEASAASEFLPPSKAGQRVLKCKTLVKAVGSTVCDFTEYQKYAFLKVPASDQYGSSGALGGFPPPPSAKVDGNRRLLIVQISGQAVGAMFSDTFRAEALCIFEEEVIGATSSSAATYHPLNTSLKAGDVGASTAAPPRVRVSMVCYGHIQFVKSVWGIKGKIVSVALGVEMPECYRNFFGNQMKPLALKLIKSRQQNQPAAAASSVEVVELGGGAGGATVLTTSSSPSPPQSGEVTTTTTTTYAASSPNTSSSSQSNQLLQVQQTSSSGGGGSSSISLRSSFSPEHLFPFAGFSPTSTSNTPLQMGLLGFVAFIAFLSVWWSASGLLSCLWGSLSLPLATPSTDSSIPVGMMGGNGGGSGIVDSTSSSMVVATVAYVETFNTYIRPLIGVLFGSVLAMSVSVLVEYVMCLLK